MQPQNDSFIVVTKTTFDPEVQDELLEVVRQSKPIFEKQPGCRSFVTHLSQDETHIMTYMEWASEQDHLNCMKSPDFNETNGVWQKLFDSGKAKLEFSIYRAI